jgi:hypothetical protein
MNRYVWFETLHENRFDGRYFFAVQIVFSSPAMASTAAGCGDDTDGDIGILPHPITVQENHTQSPAPAHGTLAIVGAVVTYTPNPGYVGPDSCCLSCNGYGDIGGTGGDGAQFAACTCNLTQVRHGRGRKSAKYFRISSGCRRVYTTCPVEFQAVRKAQSQLLKQ